ncbi:MAG: hypothetical protein HYY43_03085 [Deltaproteobacteria bacterium]|nr:hypothetical protein [Deltaproteobacteria bacterium]MBI2342164.1 hypothetical protein [Deltaproteobacteria bacterium]MBI2974556.1 hypothetical protein [Deltaproteobacteria bacterium]
MQLTFDIADNYVVEGAPMSALTGYIGQTYGYVTPRQDYYGESVKYTTYRYSTVPPDCSKTPIREIFDIKHRFEHCLLNYNFPKTKL